LRRAGRIAGTQILRVTGVVLLCAAAVGGLLVMRSTSRGAASSSRSATPTFTKDIAPLVHAKCAPCHHPNGAGPFPLLDYDDVASRAAEIRKVTSTRFMPPWRPVPGYAAYAGDRSLTDAQIELLARWIDGGSLRGDPRDMPPLPVHREGWQLGEPDLIVHLAAPYALPAEGRDVYRNLVIRAPVGATRFVKAWELRPGTRAIHHAIMNIDRYGLARRRDDADPLPGFDGMDLGGAQSADGFYLVWTPGKFAAPPDPTSSFRIDGRTDLVLQLHMQPTGKPEMIDPQIALYFADRPATRPRFTLRVGDAPIDIPPGEASHVVKAEYTVPADIDVVTVFPHAHYVAKKVRTWATLPDGTERGLLQIDDWDFSWQDEYTFASPVSLPRGTIIQTQFVYDNSAANVRNPSRPPKRVTNGEASTDEMGNVTFQVVPHDTNGMNALRESKYRRVLAGEDSAPNRYNLANVLADQGKTDDAIQQYRRAVELDPGLAVARFNLARLLLAATPPQADEAIVHLRAAVKARPDDVASHVYLGNAYEAKGQLDTANVHYRSAVAIDARSALAQNSLALGLLEAGDATGAVEHFHAAIAIEPDNWLSHHQLANALRAKGANDEAIVHYRRAIELQPNAKEARESLDALLAARGDARAQ
jgi:tetratricopeptide (TPR) repeat protein/mono/diheme cytochrome c family protein